MPPVTPTAPDDANFEARLRVELDHRMDGTDAPYRLLAENSTDVIALLSHDGTRVYVSPACLQLTGYTPEEMRALRTDETTHPDDVARVLEVLADQHRQQSVTYRMRRKDGSYVWVETTCKPLDGPGNGNLRLAVVRNVDDRIHAEQRLQESEARYRFIADNSADLIILVGPDGKRVYVSPVCERMLGFTPEEMLKLSTRDAVHPDDADRLLAVLGSDELMLADPTIRYRARRKDGSYIWVETVGTPVSIQGQPNQRLVVVRDIDQRMLAKRRLKESEARYRMLADNSSDMVFQLDRELVRRYVSPACRELLGFEPEEMIGIKPFGMAHPDDAGRLELVFQTLLDGRAARQSIINRIRHRDGRWIWVEARLRAFRDAESGAVTDIVGAVRDISERKAVEDELAQANCRLQVLATRDGLTAIANRRAFDEALAKEHRRGRREQTTLALIMIDVDLFKAFNDAYGHPVGDDCLRRVAEALAQTISRPGDLVARYGGEEFAVLLPGTDEDGAAVLGERIRQAILGLAIPHDMNAQGVVTISVGVACIVCKEKPETLVQNADCALFCAKDSGRNAMARASEAAPSLTANSSAA